MKTKITKPFKKQTSTKCLKALILITLFPLLTIIGLSETVDYTLSDITIPKPVKAVVAVEIKQGEIREVTAYNSVPWQTDDSPCVSADGTNICELDYNVCATNAFPLGTKLYVDKLGECVVHDRMNKRYKERVDWYMKMDVERARAFGLQKLLVTKVD